jgi:hypothetical protein
MFNRKHFDFLSAFANFCQNSIDMHLKMIAGVNFALNNIFVDGFIGHFLPLSIFPVLPAFFCQRRFYQPFSSTALLPAESTVPSAWSIQYPRGNR